MENNKPLIYLITDGSFNAQNYYSKLPTLLELVEVGIASGISLIQVREKNLPTLLLTKLTSEITRIAKKSDTKILVNDRVDVALATKADGVHLTRNSFSVETIRKYFPKELVVGVSAHSIDEVFRAKNEGANFAVFSPIFYSPNKGNPQGIETLSEAIKLVGDFPIIALGGVNELNFAETLDAGASGIAAIRFFNNPKKLPKIIKIIRGKASE